MASLYPDATTNNSEENKANKKPLRSEPIDTAARSDVGHSSPWPGPRYPSQALPADYTAADSHMLSTFSGVNNPAVFGVEHSHFVNIQHLG